MSLVNNRDNWAKLATEELHKTPLSHASSSELVNMLPVMDWSIIFKGFVFEHFFLCIATGRDCVFDVEKEIIPFERQVAVENF